MFRLTVLVLGLALAASASLEANWEVYKHKYNKKYLGDEDAKRRLIWEENLRMIDSHNENYAKGLTSSYMGENRFADMTSDEISATMTGFRMPEDFKPRNYRTDTRVTKLPDKVDWRDKGYVTPVKDQGNCGSCWAFSTTGSIEGQHFKATGKLVSLSESNLVDCSHNGDDDGCQGGYMDDAFTYIISNKGIDSEQGYPYRPMNGTCNFSTDKIGATIKSYVDIPHGNEDALQKAIAEIGPISVAIDSNHDSIELYRGGVVDEPNCTTTNLNHAVLVVGYGTQDGKDYYIVKNSWGQSWGDHGYLLMSRNKNNQCGIASMASYPVV